MIRMERNQSGSGARTCDIISTLFGRRFGRDDEAYYPIVLPGYLFH